MDWNKEKLIEKYMDNPVQVLEAAGIPSQQPAGPSQPTPIRSNPSTRQATSTVIRRSTRRSTADSKAAALAPVGCLICCDENEEGS